MNKAEIRAVFKTKRESLSPHELEAKSLAIANQILKLNIWDKAYYHLYLSIENQKEINTEYMLHLLQGKDKHVLVSKSDFETHTLKHYLLTDSTAFKLNRYNIPEPIDGIEIPANKIDVVFVPLLAYDIHGNRVGYGKGFYDRFLKQCRPDVIKIGLSAFEPIIKIDASVNDIRLDIVVTDKQVHYFQ